MATITKRYKGLCAFQDRCRVGPKECKFIHVATEISLQDSLILLFENIKQHLADSRSELVNEKTMMESPSQMAQNQTHVFEQVADKSVQSREIQSDTVPRSAQSNNTAHKDRATSMDEVSLTTEYTIDKTSHTKTTNLVIENECESLDATSARTTKCKGNINIADKKLVSPTKSINLIEMKDDYWLEDKGWMCQSCEKVFKLEIAFKNHLRRTELCNLSYMCGNCNADFKLDELKLHILKKPQCIGQTAILQSYFAKALTET